ncbi:hypothetical protein D5S18_27385 [Nocardia panacis]|uniref:DUF8020 domain-containing protein n=1 Tax=Nocardia panacis TaxID=2340916 RepID=A0A3A4K135_9NOCA|nr:hypothetical protein [Nocardia panacis]RJO71043.1 hypothetical protein D5S18_27385 [Nocardia panacis]
MRPSKFAATAVLAACATGIAAGAVQAQPLPGPGIAGVDHGVGYLVAPTADRAGLSTTVTSGRFAPTPDGQAIALTDATGAIVATVPLALRSTAGTVGLAATLADDGRTLTLTPQSDRTVQAIDAASDTIARKQYNAGVGALVGAGIGAVIGFFLGGVGALVTVPIGAGLGALIGYATP